MAAPGRLVRALNLPILKRYPDAPYEPYLRRDTIHEYDLPPLWSAPPRSPQSQLPGIHDQLEDVLRPVSTLINPPMPTTSNSHVPDPAIIDSNKAWHMFREILGSCHQAHMKLNEMLESIENTAASHGLKIDLIQNMSENTADQFRLARRGHVTLVERIETLQEISEQHVEAARRQDTFMQESLPDIKCRLSEIKHEHLEIKRNLDEQGTGNTEIKSRLDRLEERSFTLEDVRDVVRAVVHGEVNIPNSKAVEEVRRNIRAELQDEANKILQGQGELAGMVGKRMDGMNGQILEIQEQFVHRMDMMERAVLKGQEQLTSMTADRMDLTNERLTDGQKQLARIVVERTDEISEQTLKNQKQLTNMMVGVDGLLVNVDQQVKDIVDGVQSTNEAMKTRKIDHSIPLREIRDKATQTTPEHTQYTHPNCAGSISAQRSREDPYHVVCSNGCNQLPGFPLKLETSRQDSCSLRGYGSIRSVPASHSAQDLKLSKIVSIGEAPYVMPTNAVLPEHCMGLGGNVFLQEALSNCSEMNLSMLRMTKQDNEMLEVIRDKTALGRQENLGRENPDHNQTASDGNKVDERGGENRNLGSNLAGEVRECQSVEVAARVISSLSGGLGVEDQDGGDSFIKDFGGGDDERNDLRSFNSEDVADETLVAQPEARDRSKIPSTMPVASISEKRVEHVRPSSLHNTVQRSPKDKPLATAEPQSKKQKRNARSPEDLRSSTKTSSKQQEGKSGSNLEHRRQTREDDKENLEKKKKKKKMKGLSKKRAAKQQKNMASAILKKKDKARSSPSISSSDVGSANWQHQKRKRSEVEPKRADQHKRKKTTH